MQSKILKIKSKAAGGKVGDRPNCRLSAGFVCFLATSVNVAIHSIMYRFPFLSEFFSKITLEKED